MRNSVGDVCPVKEFFNPFYPLRHGVILLLPKQDTSLVTVLNAVLFANSIDAKSQAIHDLVRTIDGSDTFFTVNAVHDRDDSRVGTNGMFHLTNGMVKLMVFNCHNQ